MRRGGLLRPFKLIRKNMLESTKMLGVKHQIAVDIFVFVDKLGQSQIIMYRSDAGTRRCLVGFIASGSGFQFPSFLFVFGWQVVNGISCTLLYPVSVYLWPLA